MIKPIYMLRMMFLDGQNNGSETWNLNLFELLAKRSFSPSQEVLYYKYHAQWAWHLLFGSSSTHARSRHVNPRFSSYEKRETTATWSGCVSPNEHQEFRESFVFALNSSRWLYQSQIIRTGFIPVDRWNSYANPLSFDFIMSRFLHAIQFNSFDVKKTQRPHGIVNGSFHLTEQSKGETHPKQIWD